MSRSGVLMKHWRGSGEQRRRARHREHAAHEKAESTAVARMRGGDAVVVGAYGGSGAFAREWSDEPARAEPHGGSAGGAARWFPLRSTSTFLQRRPPADARRATDARRRL